MALSHAILAALCDRTCSGYDLAKQFDGSVGFFWQASHQQIYRELSKLEAQDLVEAELVQQGDRPNKKLYQVTEAGKAHLRQWILQPGTMSPVKDELLVKLFAGELVQPAELQHELQHHRTQHQQRLAEYRAIETAYFTDAESLPWPAQCQYLTLKNGISFEMAWLVWCDEALASLN
ncbi:MAG: PadR family transcriptional regulator [Cyanobacteria bacterium P01_H01_bin.121]